MARTILVALDESEQSGRALDYAREVFPNATLVLLNVFTRETPDVHRGVDDEYDDLRERRHELLREAMADRDHAGEFETAVRLGDPARQIVEYAEDEDVDGIVVGSHGRDGASRILLGSVAEKAIRRAPVPVTVVR